MTIYVNSIVLYSQLCGCDYSESEGIPGSPKPLPQSESDTGEWRIFDEPCINNITHLIVR